MPSTNSLASKPIVYPERSDLEFWIDFLSNENVTLKLALPAADDHWYECMLDVIQRVEFSYSTNDIHTRAAELFYNTNKAHNFGDGNKRSSILVVYLFYVMNDLYINKRLEVKNLAKAVAKSRGRKQHDKWLEKIRNMFESCTEPLYIDIPNEEQQGSEVPF